MKRFSFRLEKVLQYRQIVQQEKKREFARLLALLNEAESRLRELLDAQETNSIQESVEVTVDEFMLRGRYAERLKQEIVDQKLKVLQAEEEMEKAKAEYIEAAKEARALEMLKEKKKVQFEEHIALEEGKILDEMVTQRSQRAKGQQDL